MGSIMQYDMYLAAERVLLWTAAFSLAVSILIEGFLMFATRKNNNQSVSLYITPKDPPIFTNTTTDKTMAS